MTTTTESDASTRLRLVPQNAASTKVKIKPASRADEIYNALVSEYILTATHERLLARLAADSLAAAEQLSALLAKTSTPGMVTKKVTIGSKSTSSTRDHKVHPGLKVLAVHAALAMKAMDRLDLKTRMRARLDPGRNIGIGGNKAHRPRTFAEVA